MRFSPRNFFLVAGGAIIGASSALLATQAGIAEPGDTVRAMPALITPAVIADPNIAADLALLADDSVTFSPENSQDPAVRQATSTALDPELECMAKVVRHEAGNQPRRGQLAVAQLMVNRTRSGRFPTTICNVASQPGQFFDVTAYNPRRDTPQWQMAVEVSREALSGSAEDVSRGAYFYHAASQSPNGFFRNRQRVQTLGDHIFYR